MAEIYGSIKPEEIACKRFYAKGVTIHEKCPKCGKECGADLGQIAIEYPTPNKAIQFGMYCGDGCEHEWTIPIIIKMEIEIVQ